MRPLRVLPDDVAEKRVAEVPRPLALVGGKDIGGGIGLLPRHVQRVRNAVAAHVPAAVVRDRDELVDEVAVDALVAF